MTIRYIISGGFSAVVQAEPTRVDEAIIVAPGLTRFTRAVYFQKEKKIVPPTFNM